MFLKKNKKFGKILKNWKFTCNIFSKNTNKVIILKSFWEKKFNFYINYFMFRNFFTNHINAFCSEYNGFSTFYDFKKYLYNVKNLFPDTMQDMTYYQYKIWYCRPPFGARFSAAQFCQVSLSRVATCRLLVGCCGISLVELMDEWESDTYWRIFRRAFGAVRRRLVFFWSVRGTPLSYHESRPDGTGGQEVEGLMPAAANV